jgi:hypothetical protein
MIQEPKLCCLDFYGAHCEIVTTLSEAKGIDFIEAVELIIEQWEDCCVTDGKSLENQNSPLDQIEVKLERISGLCDQVIEKLESSSL